MRTLSLDEMAAVRGGNKCGALGLITALSCYTGLMVACTIGGIGYLFACDIYR